MGFTLTHTFYIGSRLQSKFQNSISKFELKINMFRSSFWKNIIFGKTSFYQKNFYQNVLTY